MADLPIGFSDVIGSDGGEMSKLIRAKDWAATPLGALETWPRNVRAALAICVNSSFPILLWIGPELRILYNDAYIPFLGSAKHPALLGAPGREAWAEIWPSIGPMHEEVAAGRSTFADDFQFFFVRSLPREEVYVTFSYSPILDDDGRTVLGVFCVCTETTDKIVRERRLSTMRRLGIPIADALDEDAACQSMATILADNPRDVPFAAIYLMDRGTNTAHRAALVHVADDNPAFPSVHSLSDRPAPGPWPFALVAHSGELVEWSELQNSVGALSTPLWPDLVEVALIVPIAVNRQERPTGFLIIGISPRRVLDEEYRDFAKLAADYIAKAIADTRTLESERRRAEGLVALNHAKTTFFSNVSHEFRTPLSLLLGPLEQLLTSSSALAGEDRNSIKLAHRNGMRLLKLVNTLLDFSRIEATRMSLAPAPTGISRLTSELASNFQSLCDSANLNLIIDCPRMPHPVSLDPVAWEKIVLNLMSNAFKFTLEGDIRVTMRSLNDVVRLTVADTGVGIPAEELPKIFERFHRIEGQPSRSAEGSGIGLALVRELVRLSGGTIGVASNSGRGTSFTVELPFLAPDARRAGTTREESVHAGSRMLAGAYVEEATSWLSSDPQPRHESASLLVPSDGRARIVLADDNIDMRNYVARLLSPHWDVEAVANGNAALDAIHRRLPDLLISDVMMPGVRGLDLVAIIRADPALALLPVILLSARAGEEARVEGLDGGADDYLVKPFAAQELIARVNSTLSLVRLRRDATLHLQRTEARLRAAIDLAGLSPYSWDPATGALEWDDRIRAMWGLPPGAHVDMDVFSSGLHPKDRPKVEAAIAQCVNPEGDGVYAIECRVIGIEDGIERWVQTFGRTIFERRQPIGFVGAVMDITQRKRAEALLRESEQRFRSFAENINGVLWIAQPQSEVVEYLSPAYERIWGEPRDGLHDPLSHWKRTVHPEDTDHVASALKRVARGEVLTYEYRIVRPDGTTRWIRDASFPIRDEEGRVRRIAGVAQDITRHDGHQIYLIGAEHAEGSSLATMLLSAGFAVKAFGSVPAFLDVAPVLMTGCVLLDLQSSSRGDLPLLKRIRARRIGIPIIVLGAADDDVLAAVRAMRAGGEDYLPRPFSDRQVLEAVASALTLIEEPVLRGQTEDQVSARLARLTKRERQVLDGILAGGTNKSIARELGISPRTVELHRWHMMEKLGAKTLREAIEIALTAGLKLSATASRSDT